MEGDFIRAAELLVAPSVSGPGEDWAELVAGPAIEDEIAIPFCVCVPARNEAARLPVLLAALADQDLAGRIPVVVAINNTKDGSAAIVQRCAEEFAARLDILVDEQVFPAAAAHAGSARRRAMDLGLAWLERDGAADAGESRPAVLLTTDADARPPVNWIDETLRAFARGADIVGGYLTLDEAEPLPEAEQAYSLLWHRYWAEVRAIQDAIDPRPGDSPPRHGDHTGGSLALTAAIYRATGGVPRIPTNEDCALVRAAVAAGGRLVHPLSVWTRVSPRRIGRAAGGMADAMAELHEAVSSGRTIMAPALDHWRRRAVWRRRLRLESGSDAVVARAEARLPPLPEDRPLAEIVARF